jgi:hypothetical protein
MYHLLYRFPHKLKYRLLNMSNYRLQHKFNLKQLPSLPYWYPR